MNHGIKGVLTAMITPFAEDGSVDFKGAAKIARYLVNNGSDGLVVAGTTGESPTLDDSEKLALLASVLDEVGDEALVACGTGSNDTRHSVELTAAAAEVGAHAALIVTPYYNKPNPTGIKAHFSAVAEAAPDTPLIIYNIPSRVVVNIGPELLAELALIENIVAVKQANNEELQLIEGLDILAGNDEVFIETLEIGGAGGILVSSHLVGSQMQEIWSSAQGGDMETARAINRELEALYAVMGVTTNPIPVKAALEMIGLDSGRLRLPMVTANETERKLIRQELEKLDLLATARG